MNHTNIGVDASGMGLGTVQHGIALAAELQFVRLQQGVLMGLAVRTVFAFAVGGFGIDIDAGLGTNGNADADLYAGIAVFAVLMLAVLGGEQPDVARGIGQLVGLGAGGQGLQGAGAVVGFAYLFSAKAKTKLPNLLRSLGRESLTKKLIINEISLNRSPLTSPTASYR